MEGIRDELEQISPGIWERLGGSTSKSSRRTKVVAYN